MITPQQIADGLHRLDKICTSALATDAFRFASDEAQAEVHRRHRNGLVSAVSLLRDLAPALAVTQDPAIRSVIERHRFSLELAAKRVYILLDDDHLFQYGDGWFSDSREAEANLLFLEDAQQLQERHPQATLIHWPTFQALREPFAVFQDTLKATRNRPQAWKAYREAFAEASAPFRTNQAPGVLSTVEHFDRHHAKTQLGYDALTLVQVDQPVSMNSFEQPQLVGQAMAGHANHLLAMQALGRALEATTEGHEVVIAGPQGVMATYLVQLKDRDFDRVVSFGFFSVGAGSPPILRQLDPSTDTGRYPANSVGAVHGGNWARTEIPADLPISELAARLTPHEDESPLDVPRN